MSREHQRSKYYVSRRIQGRLVGRLAFYWVMYHLVLWHMIFTARYIGYRASLITGETEYQSIGELYMTFAMDYAALAICALALTPIFLFDMFRQSHRIAGPLVRFQNSLKQLAAGQTVVPFRLRKNDLLTEFEVEFNEFLTYYATRVDVPKGAETQPLALSEAEADILERTISQENETTLAALERTDRVQVAEATHA
jgi:hypothetical protein